MGKVEVVKAFDWSPDGIRVVTIPEGDVVEGRAAEVAMQLDAGRPVSEDGKRRVAAAGPERTPSAKPPAKPRRR